MRWYNREVKNLTSDLDLNSALPCSLPSSISSLVIINVVDGDPKRSHFLKLSPPVSQLIWKRRDSRPRQGCCENSIIHANAKTVLVWTITLIRAIITFHERLVNAPAGRRNSLGCDTKK